MRCVRYSGLQSRPSQGRRWRLSKLAAFRFHTCSFFNEANAMKFNVLMTFAILFAGKVAFGQGLDSFYKLGPDSLEQEGVPHGKIVGPLTLPCKVYPGTSHTYWV